MGFDAKEPVHLIGVVAQTRVAIPLDRVERVEAAVAVTPLAGAPHGVLGVIDYHGSVLPVYSGRARLGQPAAPIHPDMYFVLLETPRRRLALCVDAVEMTAVLDGKAIEIEDTFSAQGLGLGLGRTADGLVVILDLDRFLTAEAEGALDDALQTAGREA